jgi:hypothetical protein
MELSADKRPLFGWSTSSLGSKAISNGHRRKQLRFSIREGCGERQQASQRPAVVATVGHIRVNEPDRHEWVNRKEPRRDYINSPYINKEWITLARRLGSFMTF